MVIDSLSADNTQNRDGVEKIQVLWEDDGTESPFLGEDDAVKVSDLDEPLAGGWLDRGVRSGRGRRVRGIVRWLVSRECGGCGSA